MNTKHTPAPWKLIDGWDENGKGSFPSVILYGTESQYRRTYGRNGITINCSHDQKVESLMANAKLIAAAPELLEALIPLVNFCSAMPKDIFSQMGLNDLDYILNKSKDAIKKATE